MTHFYGKLEGKGQEVTRTGTKSSGLRTIAAGRKGAIETIINHKDGKDIFAVWLIPWNGSGGKCKLLAEGELDNNSP